MEQKWRKLDGTLIQRPIEDEIRASLVKEKEMGHELKVCIGTDSQVKGKETEFATVIVFIRKGKGGFMLMTYPCATRAIVSNRRRRRPGAALDFFR